MEVKKWVEWCNRCGHGFKVEAGKVEMTEFFDREEVSSGFINRLFGRKKKEVIRYEVKKPEVSPCPICGKTDEVTVIKLQEDHIADIK